MQRRASNLVSLIAYLQLLYSPYTSMGSPLPTAVFPRILEERSDSGELIVSIRSGQTLALTKASVFREKLEVATLEENARTFHYAGRLATALAPRRLRTKAISMNGSGMERNLYHDPLAGAALIITRDRGLRLVGILGTTERIEPSPAAGNYSGGSVRHDILPLEQKRSDVDISSDIRLEDIDRYPKFTPSEPPNQDDTKVFEARSGSPYPIKATCETRIAVDSAYFRSFHDNQRKLVDYLAVLVAFTNLKLRTFQKNILDFQLVVTGIVIFSSNAERFIRKANDEPSVMLSDTLSHFRTHVKSNPIFRDDDAAILLTGLDLAMNYGVGKPLGNGIAGIAGLATACSQDKVAIVEDVPRTFSSAHTMAHEIGHLVGSAHDGSTNTKMRVDGTSCPAAERKIMAPYAGAMNLVQEFSYCSTCQVAEFIMSGAGGCLKTNITSNNTTKLTFERVNSTKPSLDEFCRRHYTEHKDIYYKVPNTPQLRLQNCIITCAVPTKPGSVIINDAPDGTSCNGTRAHAICINGKCTYVKYNRVQTLQGDIGVVRE